MKKLTGRELLMIGTIVVSLGVSLVKSYAQEEFDMDYFDPKHRGTLSTVERYHLTKQTFWKEFGTKQYGYALGELKFVLRYFPNHPRALMLMQLVAKTIGQPFLPIPYYGKAVRLYAQYAITHTQYGGYLVDIGQIEEGITRLQKAIEIDPKLAVAYDWLSGAYTKSGNPEMARQTDERAKVLGLKMEIPGEQQKK